MAAAADSQNDQKTKLRRALSDQRTRLSPVEKTAASAAVCDRLDTLPVLARARVVAGFVAVRGEIDPAAALARVRDRGDVVALPRVTDGAPRLRFHRAAASDAGDLRPGRFGLLEPDAAWPEVALEAIDVMVVPGLAFDGAGRRLGYGGGYYDEVARFLGDGRRTALVGIGYDFQLVDRCPADGRDAPVDWVVTDARTVRCARPPGARQGGGQT